MKSEDKKLHLSGIYAFRRLDYPKYEGYLKIGQTTKEVEERIAEQLETAANPLKEYEIVGNWEPFDSIIDKKPITDKKIHRELRSWGFFPIYHWRSGRPSEYYKITYQDLCKIINHFKYGKNIKFNTVKYDLNIPWQRGNFKDVHPFLASQMMKSVDRKNPNKLVICGGITLTSRDFRIYIDDNKDSCELIKEEWSDELSTHKIICSKNILSAIKELSGKIKKGEEKPFDEIIANHPYGKGRSFGLGFRILNETLNLLSNSGKIIFLLPIYALQNYVFTGKTKNFIKNIIPHIKDIIKIPESDMRSSFKIAITGDGGIILAENSIINPFDLKKLSDCRWVFTKVFDLINKSCPFKENKDLIPSLRSQCLFIDQRDKYKNKKLSEYKYNLCIFNRDYKGILFRPSFEENLKYGGSRFVIRDNNLSTLKNIFDSYTTNFIKFLIKKLPLNQNNNFRLKMLPFIEEIKEKPFTDKDWCDYFKLNYKERDEITKIFS